VSLVQLADEPRFLRQVEPGEAVFRATKCQLWTSSKSNGYGSFSVKRADGRWTSVRAHRWAFERWIGPFPADLHVDHLCHNADPGCVVWDECPHRACVNPFHLEPTWPGINTLRGHGLAAANVIKTQCSKGHKFTPENTYFDRKGRDCRICKLGRSRADQARRSAIRAAARRAALIADSSLREHGSVRTYRDYGCRCDPCREASKANLREYRQRRKAMAS
jgi:hypothetical protein